MHCLGPCEQSRLCEDYVIFIAIAIFLCVSFFINPFSIIIIYVREVYLSENLGVVLLRQTDHLSMTTVHWGNSVIILLNDPQNVTAYLHLCHCLTLLVTKWNKMLHIYTAERLNECPVAHKHNLWS